MAITVAPSMKDHLTQNDNVTLNFTLNFNDGFTAGISNDTLVNVVIKGDNTVPVNAAAPDPALAEVSAVPLVSALAAPDIVLPGMDLALLMNGQGIMPAQQAQGGHTLEPPLPEAPTPDLTSAPGQEALQFQLQTTGV